MNYRRFSAGFLTLVFTATWVTPTWALRPMHGGGETETSDANRQLRDRLSGPPAAEPDFATAAAGLETLKVAAGLEGWPPVIAIDGTAASGKSAVAREVAERLNAIHLPLGTLYRAVTWLALRSDLDPTRPIRLWDREELLHQARGIRVAWADRRMQVAYQPSAGAAYQPIPGSELRHPRLDRQIPEFAKYVHEPLVALAMRTVNEFGLQGMPVVVEGRIATTVVAPGADVRAVLSADLNVRAQRRAADQPGRSVREVAQALQRRDTKDAEQIKEAFILFEAPSAIGIATDQLSVAQVADQLLQELKQSEQVASVGITPEAAQLIQDLEAHGKYAIGNTLPAQLRERVLALFPELARTTQVDDGRLEHIFRVIHSFAWISNNSALPLYGLLPPGAGLGLPAYAQQIQSLAELYQGFSQEERQAAWLTVILHDVGVAQTVVGHDQISADWSGLLLRRINAPRNLIGLIQGVIRHHHDIGGVTLGEFTPAYFLEGLAVLPQGQRDLALRLRRLMAASDLAGFSRGTINFLTPYWLDRFSEFSDPGNLKRLDKEERYVDYRLWQLGRPDTQIPLTAQQREALERVIQELVSPEERALFRDALNRILILDNVAGYIHALASLDPTYRAVVKLLRFYVHVAATTRQMPFEEGEISRFEFTLYGKPQGLRKPAMDRLLVLLEQLPDRMSLAQASRELEENNWSGFYGIPVTLRPGKLEIDPELLLLMRELEPIRQHYAQARGFARHLGWQIEEAALDRGGQPALAESTSESTRMRSRRAHSALKLIGRAPEAREDFKAYVARAPIGHTFRNRITPAALAIANFLSGRPFNDRQILSELPPDLLEGNVTIAQHPWFGEGVQVLPEVAPSAGPVLADRVRILVAGAGEKADMRNSGLRYLKKILEATPSLRGKSVEIVGNDIQFQEGVYGFGSQGNYLGLRPAMVFDPQGKYVDPESGITLMKLSGDGLLAEPFSPEDAGRYDVVLVSRVAVQFRDRLDWVSRLRENSRKYLAPEGLLLFDTETADHLEVIRAGQVQPESVTVPYLDVWAFERRLMELIPDPAARSQVAEVHRLAERYANWDNPLDPKYRSALTAAKKGASPDQIAQILRAGVPQAGLEGSAVKSALVELTGIRNLVSAQRWTKRVPRGAPKAASLRAQATNEARARLRGAIQTVALAARRDGVDFNDQKALQLHITRNFGARRFLIAGGKGSRFGGEDPFTTKQMYRADGAVPMMKQAREASGFRFPGVQDVVAVNDRTLYHMLREKSLSSKERGGVLRVVHDKLPEALARALRGYEPDFEKEFQGKGPSFLIREVLGVGVEEILELVRTVGQRELRNIRSPLSEYRPRGDQPPIVRGHDFKSFIVKLGLKLDERFPQIAPDLREHILDEIGFLTVAHWIDEARDKTGAFEALIDAGRLEDLVGGDAILALTRLEGPGGAFLYGLQELQRRDLQDQTRLALLAFADRPTFGLDDYPNVFLAGYLAVVNQMRVRTPDGQRPLFDPSVQEVDPRITELPVATVASKSPTDKYEGRSSVWRVPAHPGAPQDWLAAEIKEYHGFTHKEQQQIADGFAMTRQTGEPHHHLDGGLFVFDIRWVQSHREDWRNRYPHAEKGRFVLYQTDLVKLAYSEYLDRVVEDSRTMPMTRNVVVGINAPGGAGKRAEADRYADRRNENIIRRLRKLGVRVAKKVRISVTSQDGDLNLDRDLPRIFEAGLEGPEIRGQVSLDTSVQLGPDVLLDGTREPVVLRRGTVVLSGAKLVGPVTAENSWIGPGATVEGVALEAQLVIPGERVTSEVLRAREEALRQLTQDPLGYLSEAARHDEFSPPFRERFWGGAYQPATQKFIEMAGLSRRRKAQVMRQMERLYHHPIYQRLNPTEMYRYLFALIRSESRRRDPFVRPPLDGTQAVVRQLAQDWLSRIQSANGDRAALRSIFDELLKFVTAANLFDHQSKPALALIGKIQAVLRTRGLSPGQRAARIMALMRDAVAGKWAVDDRQEIKRRVFDVPPGTFLYLTDNLEEAEADVALWVLLGELGHRVVVAAKSRPIFSDITRGEVEAQLSAVPELGVLHGKGLFLVISSGSDVYGTPLHLASEDLLAEVRRPDFRAVIGKGQGNLYTSAARNPLTYPYIALLLVKGMTAGRVVGGEAPPKETFAPVAAYLPPGTVANRAINPEDPKVAVGSLAEVVQARQSADADYAQSSIYSALSRIVSAGLESLEDLLRHEEWRTGRTRGEILQGRLHPATIRAFLDEGGIDAVLRRRAAEQYDVLVVGGGTAGRMAAQALAALGYRVLIVTLGSDNGGLTQDRIAQLSSRFGWTFPVGDVSNALIGFMTPLKQEILNVRSLDPAAGNLTQHVERQLQRVIREHPDWRRTDPDLIPFAVELLNLARVAESQIVPFLPVGKPLSIRHELFNGLMAATGAYDPDRKRIDPDRFEAGLYLFERAFGLPGRVIPNSVDPQTLLAEWDVIDPATGDWLRAEGQVAISLIQDERKRKADGTLARYRSFGFRDPVTPYPSLLRAVRQQLKPGGAVYYGFSSAVVSRSPQVAIPEVAEALTREDVAKVWLGNVTWNNETAFMSWEEEADFHEMVTGLPLSATVDYLVVNSEWPRPAAVYEAQRLAKQHKEDYRQVLAEVEKETELGKEALRRLGRADEVKDPKRQLLLAAGFADWGDHDYGWKFRGGRPLHQQEKAALMRRGMTVLELPLLKLTKSPMRFGYGENRQEVDLPLPVVDPEQYRLIDRMVRTHFHQRSAAGLEVLKGLASERWLARWSATFRGFDQMSKQHPASFETFGIFLDQANEGHGQRGFSFTVPARHLLAPWEQEMVLRYLTAELNNIAWFFLRQPKDTTRSETRIRLSGDWAAQLKKWVEDRTELMPSLSLRMLYGPISLVVADGLPAEATWTKATHPVRYIEVSQIPFNAKEDVPVLGVDVGGTNLKFVILKAGRVIHAGWVPDWSTAEAEVGEMAQEGLAHLFAKHIRQQLRDAGLNPGQLEGIGFSWPGPVRAPIILGSVSLERLLKGDEKNKGLIRKVQERDIPGNSAVLEEELRALQEGRFKDFLQREIVALLGREISILPYRDAFAEAFGIAVALYRPDFSGGRTTNASEATATFTMGTGMGAFLVEPDGRIPVPGDPLLYELGRVVVDMDPGAEPNRSTKVPGTVRELFSGRAMSLTSEANLPHLAEALAATGMVMADFLGAKRMTLSGWNARQDVVEAAQRVVERLTPAGEEPVQIMVSPVAAAVHLETSELPPKASKVPPPTMFTPAIGAAWAALADVSRQKEAGLEDNLRDYLKVLGVRETLEETGVSVLSAASASRLYGAGELGNRSVLGGILRRVEAGPSVWESPGVIWADSDVEAKVRWASLPVIPAGAGWSEMVMQAMPDAKPEDLFLVESELGLTKEIIEAVLRRKFPEGPIPQAILGKLAEYELLGDQAGETIRAIWIARNKNRNLPPVVEIGVVFKLQTDAGETYHLLLMV